jgi:hypothetical protein
MNRHPSISKTNSFRALDSRAPRAQMKFISRAFIHQIFDFSRSNPNQQRAIHLLNPKFFPSRAKKQNPNPLTTPPVIPIPNPNP